MAEDQRARRIFGVLFILTFVTSIAALALFQSVLDDPAGYIAGGGKDNQIYLGAFLEFLLVLANVGTAVVLYPIARRQNEYLAIGYVGARIIESVFIATGIIFILGVVSLRSDASDAADLAVSLAQLKDWTFLLGPGMVVPFGNGLILGYLMYKSGLVPRRMAWLGMIGGPLLLIGNIGVLFDVWDQTGPVSLLVVPEFIWEAFLGIYCESGGSSVTPRSSRRRPVEPADHRNARTAARGCAALLAAPVGPVWGCVRRALRDRLVRERRGCARLRRFGSSLDELGGRQPVAEPHRRVIDAARRVRVPLLPIDDAQRARRGGIVDLGPSTTRSRRVRRRPDRDRGNDDGDRHHQLRHLRRGRRRSCGQSGGRDKLGGAVPGFRDGVATLLMAAGLLSFAAESSSAGSASSRLSAPSRS